MPRGQRSQENAADRLLWREGRTPGKSAVFVAGETVRCPGPLLLSMGGATTCAKEMGTVKPGSRVIVRVRNPRLTPMPHVGKDVACPDCGAQLEEFVVAAEAPRLEATG